MTALTKANCTIYNDTLSSGLKSVWFVTDDTIDADDTLAITLADWGITTLVSVQTFVQSTISSIITLSASTTTISSGVLTIVLKTGTSDDTYVVHLTGE